MGLFGLRKAGKTSLLNAVAANREELGRAVVKLDLSKVSSGDHFRGRLLDLTRLRRKPSSLGPGCESKVR